MARSGFSTSNYLGFSSTIVASPPCTISAWCYPTGVSSTPVIGGMSSNPIGDRLVIYLDTSGHLNAQSEHASTGVAATTTTTASLNAWSHCVGIFASTTSRTAILNGGGSGSNTISNAPVCNQSEIGCVIDGGIVSHPFTGSLGEFAIWNVALTSSEAGALAKGVPAFLIRPASLVGYWPCYGLTSPEPDLSGAAHNMSITGSLSQANGPPVVPFSKPFWRGSYALVPSGGGSTFNVSLSELASPSDLFSETATFPVAISESLTIKDKPSEVKVIVLTIAETVSPSDTYSEVATFAAAIAEAAIATDTPSEVAVFTVSVAEAAQASDSNVVPVGVSKSLSEIASISDAFTQTTVPAPIKPYLAPPFFIEDSKQHRRILTEAVQALYRGKGPVPIDNFTLNANATSTTLYDPRIGWYSHVAFMPQTANAASLASSIYVPQSQMINGQLTVMHSSTTDTDCTFRVILWG